VEGQLGKDAFTYTTVGAPGVAANGFGTNASAVEQPAVFGCLAPRDVADLRVAHVTTKVMVIKGV